MNWYWGAVMKRESVNEAPEINKSKNEKPVRIENANDIIFRFSVINYTAAFIGILVRYFLTERSTWDMILLFGVVLAIVGQIIFHQKMKQSCCYGRFTMLLAAILFTVANIMFDSSVVLIVLLPMILLCILYMNRSFLNIMYGVWIANAGICLMQLLRQENVSVEEWKNFIVIMFVCALFGVSAYMVNGSLAFHYANVCSSLKSENKRNRQFYKESIADSTTGLWNRNAYNSYLRTFDASELNSMCCIYVDVNGLHEYNNTYGHHAGDKMLKIVAASMQECFSSDKLYRIGGDEFVILSEDSNFRSQLEELNKFRAQMKLRRIHIASGMEWRDEDMNIEEMVKIADAKMYQDKERFYKTFPETRDTTNLYKKVVD